MTGANLTPSERNVVRRVASGESNAEIAKALFISSNTVKTHLRRIFAKLGCTSRTGLAVYYAMVMVNEREREQWCRTPTAQAFMRGVAQLSNRRLQILDTLAFNPDKTNKELGVMLGISEDTIKGHLQAIRRRCGGKATSVRAFQAVARRITYGKSANPQLPVNPDPS